LPNLPSEPSDDRSGDRLESWKDIAAYLKRDVSTVQRWERREDMPVHRHVHTKAGSVYGFRRELDTWLASRKPQLDELSEPPAGDAVAPSGTAARSRAPAGRTWLILGATTLALAAAAGVFYKRGGFGDPRTSPAPTEIRSLAVLPLRNLSGDPTQDYFADGMTEALIARLSSIQGLRVISRTSAMHFKATTQTVPEIAKALRVQAVIEGSVIRSGGRIRITTQLIRADTDEHMWSAKYDRELQDVLVLQSEVAQAIAEQIEITVSGDERGRITQARKVLPDAYESYLKGRFALNRTKAGLEEAIGHFQAAINSDPGFAPAYSALAAAHSNLSSVFIGAPPLEARAKAIAEARKALELDPDLAEAHVILAVALSGEWQWTESERRFRRALELNPSHAVAHVGLARWLLSQGRIDEALALAQRGRELDPLALFEVDIAWILFHARRYGDAIRELRTVLAVHPDDVVALWYLGFALIGDGQSDEAVRVLEKTASLSLGNPAVLGVLTRAYTRAGRRTDALRLVGELNRRRTTGYVPAAAFVNAYLGLGDHEQAFAWLDRAYDEHSAMIQWLRVHPFFDPIRADPRLDGLVRRVFVE
jgi:TolB-like protein/Flp pilus assembly protein TadD